MAKAIPFSGLKLSGKKMTANACWTGTKRAVTMPPKREDEQKMSPRLPIAMNWRPSAASASIM